MDGDRFDRMTRGLLAGASRRSLLAGLFGGAVATVVGAELLEAKKGGKGKGRGRGRGRGRGNGNGGNGNGNGGSGDNGNKRTICHCPPGDPDNCHTIRVGKNAAQSHLRNHPGDTAGPCDDDQDQCLPVTDTEGDVTEESNGQFTAHAEGAIFGNLIFSVPDDTTFAELESLASEFEFLEGQCGVGSPRFVVFLDNDRCPYAQFPPELCSDPDSSGNTGNLIGNDTPFVWNDDLCGGNAANNTYTEVLAAYETATIDQIVLVTDSSSGTATVTLDPCISLTAS
jgi:hypothetical protein